jgi:hypothetical protein
MARASVVFRPDASGEEDDRRVVQGLPDLAGDVAGKEGHGVIGGV